MKRISFLHTPYWRCVTAAIIGFGVQLVTAKVLMHIWHTQYTSALLLGTVVGFLAFIVSALMLFYPLLIKPFIVKHAYVLAAAACCIVFVGLGILTINQGWHFSKTNGESITYDEVSLLPNGYYYEQNGTYFTNPEHPPLVKDIAALPFTALRAKQPQPPLAKKVLFQDYAQYYWGKTFLFQSNNNTEAIIFWARATVLLANAILIFLIFISLARIWSQRAGFIAVFFMTTSQFILGHASLVTVDVMSGLFTVLTLIWFSRWLQNWRSAGPTRASFWLVSISCMGALVSKFSTILLLPILCFGAIAYGLANKSHLRGRGKQYAWSIVGMLAAILALITIFYVWHVRHMEAADIITQLHHSYSKQLPHFGLSVLQAITHLGVLGRAFAEFANGILMVNNRIYYGSGNVYFAGHLYGSGGSGPLYFPLLYITKLQLLYLALSLGTVILVSKKLLSTKLAIVRDRLYVRPLPLVIGVYIAIFAAIAMVSTLQIGLRHIMPVIMGSMVLVALGIEYWIKQPLRTKRVQTIRACMAIMAIMVGSVLVSFPHYISYYNPMAGGTSNGYKLAVDSNYDWGQDLKALAAWQQQHPGAEVHFSLFYNPFLPINYYLGDAQPYTPGISPALPSGAYLAVSAHIYQLNVHNSRIPASQQYHQFDKDLVARVGTTIFIYKIP